MRSPSWNLKIGAGVRAVAAERRRLSDTKKKWGVGELASADTVARALALLSNGVSVRETARHLGMSKSAVGLLSAARKTK